MFVVSLFSPCTIPNGAIAAGFTVKISWELLSLLITVWIALRYLSHLPVLSNNKIQIQWVRIWQPFYDAEFEIISERRISQKWQFLCLFLLLRIFVRNQLQQITLAALWLAASANKKWLRSHFSCACASVHGEKKSHQIPTERQLKPGSPSFPVRKCQEALGPGLCNSRDNLHRVSEVVLTRMSWAVAVHCLPLSHHPSL